MKSGRQKGLSVSHSNKETRIHFSRQSPQPYVTGLHHYQYHPSDEMTFTTGMFLHGTKLDPRSSSASFLLIQSSSGDADDQKVLEGKIREWTKRTREISWLWLTDQRMASGINVYKYWDGLYYSSLGSLTFTLHGVKYLLFVPFENPKDYHVLVNAYTFGGMSQ